MATLDVKFSKFDNRPWGFRLAGGSDFPEPLTVIRVSEGSLAECMGLKVGDVVVKLNDQDVSELTHGQAHEALVLAGNNFVLAVRRTEDPSKVIEEIQEKIEPYMLPIEKILFDPLEEKREGTPDEVSEIKDESVLPPEPEAEKVEAEIYPEKPRDEYSEKIPNKDLTDEEIAQLILDEEEVLNEKGVLGVNFKKIRPRAPLFKQSEVFKELVKEELVKEEPAQAQHLKRHTTFLQRPERAPPKPRTNSQSESDKPSGEQTDSEGYKVVIKKQPKKSVTERLLERGLIEPSRLAKTPSQSEVNGELTLPTPLPARPNWYLSSCTIVNSDGTSLRVDNDSDNKQTDIEEDPSVTEKIYLRDYTDNTDLADLQKQIDSTDLTDLEDQPTVTDQSHLAESSELDDLTDLTYLLEQTELKHLTELEESIDLTDLADFTDLTDLLKRTEFTLCTGLTDSPEQTDSLDLNDYTDSLDLTDLTDHSTMISINEESAPTIVPCSGTITSPRKKQRLCRRGRYAKRCLSRAFDSLKSSSNSTKSPSGGKFKPRLVRRPHYFERIVGKGLNLDTPNDQRRRSSVADEGLLQVLMLASLAHSLRDTYDTEILHRGSSRRNSRRASSCRRDSQAANSFENGLFAFRAAHEQQQLNSFQSRCAEGRRRLSVMSIAIADKVNRAIGTDVARGIAYALVPCASALAFFMFNYAKRYNAQAIADARG
ncbi:hypothetical protein QAD02_015772 [Eretmocerus hayati]|uniref:Uncharacterized protein n=1 Tax=Eretmocerus hayati TaxID=131215 RepID=A0ACC2P998_9HYME|nr:hypothetical protein QAD02_015772 [Eretmocerus hayati]